MAESFSSRLSKPQAIAVLLWFPVHVLLLPFLLSLLMMRGWIGSAAANFLIYAIGAVYMLLVLRRFFRRDFDPLCDHPFRTLLLVIGAYWLARVGEVMVVLLFDALSVTDVNGNNESVIAMVKGNLGPTAAMAVLLAPIVEESLFRAGVFGLLRRKNRFLAYAASMLLFGLYHVLGDAIYDPRQLIFILQYLPSSFALAYVYDRSDSILAAIFLHMLSNGVSTLAVMAS
ncbi:MAG: CPBP family glutamic-type intramembrane protease [Clostridia bacterium]